MLASVDCLPSGWNRSTLWKDVPGDSAMKLVSAWQSPKGEILTNLTVHLIQRQAGGSQSLLCCHPLSQAWNGLFQIPPTTLPNPALDTLKMNFSLWSVRPVCGFPYWIPFCGWRAKHFLACCFQECACYTGGFYFTSFEWNGSHPAGLGACINRGTRKPAFNIQNINQPPCVLHRHVLIKGCWQLHRPYRGAQKTT